ncbi:hypothetical protein HMPREF3213_01027 [Heyndrickxia coagulans]|uniref:Uncharacterized protein n=1 Tax=Heyndrickxia coagulans TaxID=1398 RepID=A0A133KWI8_HEYCO|nr:hypothetical protein HMPREF3213_01027 [Heyndrickxia coagulans]
MKQEKGGAPSHSSKKPSPGPTALRTAVKIASSFTQPVKTMFWTGWGKCKSMLSQNAGVR